MTAQSVFIIDTNVIVAGLISSAGDSPTARILDAMLGGRILYLLSPDLLQEYRAVLTRPRLRRLHGLTEAEIDQILTELTANAVWREPVPEGGAPDPGDDHLWDLLNQEPGAALVSGDKLLLNQPPSSCSVMSPAGMLEHIRTQAPPKGD